MPSSFSNTDLEYMFWAGIRNGSIGTIGTKGDPGGWNIGTVVGTGVSLDTITTPGLYLNPNTNAAAGPPNANQSIGGHMRVQATSNYILQEYISITENREVYSRYRTSAGVWSAWYVFTSTRVDQTAGRAIYQWDDVNNREQLIYGDTGWRDVTPDTGTLAGWLRIRRVGNRVSLWIHGWVAESVGGSINIYTVPSQFATGNNSISGFWGIRDTLPVALGLSTTGLVTAPNTSTQAGIFAYLSWETITPWPTALPGTANGTIPYN